MIHASGVMADLIRAHDWSATPLGAIAEWTPVQLAMVNLVLCSPLPAALHWGSELSMVYNDAYRSFLGSKHPETLGQSAQIAWAEAWQHLGPLYEAAFTEGHSSLEDDVCIPILIDGVLEPRYWMNSIDPVHEDGRIVAVFNCCQDNTRTIEATHKLQESEARARRVLLSIGDAVIVTDAEARVTRMNAVAETLTRWTEAEALGHPLAEVFRIVNETTRETVESPADKVKRLGTIVGLANHTVLIGRDGTETSIEDSGAPIRNASNDLTGIVLVFRDVTEKREIEREKERLTREMEASFAELRAIYDSAAVALALISPQDFVYLRANRKLAEMVNIPVDQLIGTSVLANAADPAGLRARLQTAAGGTAVTGEILEGVLAGTPEMERFWQVDYLPVRNAAGEVIGIAAASIEITEQKNAERSLLQSEKLAAVGRLAASIAHEINNPLESVTNLLYLARASKDQAEIQNYLDVAERELRRVSAISNQTLRFHKQSTRPIAVSCEELVESVLSIYQGRLVNSRIEVQKRKRAHRSVTCFDGEIRQVLNNLVGNSIDAMHPSGGRLQIRSREATEWMTGRRGLVITIADDGSGMSPVVLKKLFHPFFTTKGIGGTGLGLWISSEIVARHHGGLRIRSAQKQEAHGTVASVFLPFEAATR